MTVQEWERKQGLPPYTLYPEAKDAKPTERGYFMYRNATEEEKQAWANARGAHRKLDPPADPEARKQYMREWYARYMPHKEEDQSPPQVT